MDTQINQEDFNENGQVLVQPVVQEKMGWYKFIIFVQLPLNMLINAITGFTYIANPNKEVYGNTNTFMGIAALLMVATAFCVHYGLRKFINLAPKFFIALNALQVAINVIQVVVYTHLGIEIFGLFTPIAVGVALIIINILYFGKRQYLFTMEDERFKFFSVALFAACIVIFLAYAGSAMSLPAVSKTTSDSQESSIFTDDAEKTEDVRIVLENEIEKEETAITEEESSDNDSLIFHQYEMEYVDPIFDGNNYVSSVLGLKLELPSNMVFVSNEEIASMEGVSSDNFYEKRAEDINSGVIRSEMCASVPDDNPLGRILVRVRYYGISDQSLLDELDLTKFIDKDSLLEQWGANDLTIETMDGDFCDRPYKGISIVYDFGDDIYLYQTQYMFIYKGYCGYIITYGESQEQCDEYLDAFVSAE